MAATACFITRIIGAEIAVVAVQGGAAIAHARRAAVDQRAGIAIAAKRRIVGIDATSDCVTGIVGARVAVTADLGDPGEALAALARVADRAGIVVVTHAQIARVNAPFAAVTAVVGARIAIDARERLAALAVAVCASVIQRARVAVVTRRHILCKYAAFRWVAAVAGARIAVVAGLAA